MTTLKILAVDDEPLALRRIRHIMNEIPGAELVGEALGCVDAVRKIDALGPDVLLLDISMRDGTGFDLIEVLSPKKVPAIIFVTAFDNFAVKAFEVSAIDFVLKPIVTARLQAAIERARVRIAKEDAEQQLDEMRSVIDSLRNGVRDQPTPRFETELWIRKNDGSFSRVSVDSIRWVESEDDYIRVHTAQSSYLMRGSIRRLETKIDVEKFARIHRKTLVRIEEIAELSSRAYGQLQVRLQDGQNLPVGRVYARNLRKIISQQRAKLSVAMHA